VNTAGVQQGDTVVVVGIGGIGSGALQGARLAGAEQIVAIDPIAWKREKAETFGATHAAPSMAEATELVRDLTRGVMADAVILTPGTVEGAMIAEALDLTRKAGSTVVTGLAAMTETAAHMSLTMFTLYQKRLLGSLYGEANPRADIPRLLRLYRAGRLLLDETITREYKLADINIGYADMLAGRNIRGLVRHQH
jgi:S-(hydroxymethyl)glutathione dehydrogenase/alcohol dehydrogenase